MSVRKIARRGFLVGSAAIAGGVAFGTYLVVRTPDNPLAKGLADGEATFNPWVMITDERITLITPHVDLGQGVEHLQALLIAEEMDLELGQFDTSFGQPSPAYFNKALLSEGVPFAPSDDGTLAAIARGTFGAVGKVLGLQGTGGSTSVPDSFDKLRAAGAVARETLKRAASQAQGVPVSDLTTRAGMVIMPDGRSVPYQKLAATAATLQPEKDVVLRPESKWRLIGKPTQRVDMVTKSTGTQDYGIDMRLPGMLYAAVRLSPTRGAAISVETKNTRTVPGVTDVLKIQQGYAIIAQNTWSAMQGALALEIEWDAAPYPAEQQDHWAKLEASFTPAQMDKVWRSDGALDAMEQHLSAEYRTPYVAHQPLEPLNATVLVDDDKVEIWAAHQLPRMLEDMAADVTGHDPDSVVFHNRHAGGSFGHRLEMDSVLCAVEIAAHLKGTPVKLTFSREEDFAHDYPRHIGIARAQGTIANGHVTGLALDIAAAPPIISQMARLNSAVPGPDSQIAAGVWAAPYALADFHVRAFRADGLAPVSSWRSVGASSNGFYLEGFLDELIHAAGADPLEERLRLCSWDVARGVLETVGQLADWGSVRPSGHGLGLSLVESFGVPVAQVIEVVETDAGIRILQVWAVADAGRVVDPVNFESQMQGGVIWGLGHAINSEITYSEGRAQQSNYHDAEGMRLHQTPQIEIQWLEKNRVIRGIGEPPVPPAAPALANAIFAATGQRIREMPFHKFVDFV